MKTIINIYNHLLAYSDNVGNTDNPQQRNYDWARRLSSVKASKTASDTLELQPGETRTLLNEAISLGIGIGDQLSLSFVKGSTYKLSIDTGTGAFKTGRAVTGLDGTTVGVVTNNNAVATFAFDGAVDLSSVQVGDCMRIAGVSTFATTPYAFEDINSGIWKVLSVVGQVVQVSRGTECFAGIAETSDPLASTDVQFYAPDGVAEGDNILIDDPFSAASHGSYRVVDATADCVYFTSTAPIPEESGVIADADTISVYKKARFLIYVESDQKTILRINGDTSDTIQIKPIAAGDPSLVGLFQYTGLCYQLEIVNNSVNQSTVRYFTAE